ncbi:MAG: hypothetical protein F4Y27_08690 [Acidimicrobiaceae bacterium]|nr:hypothetical protein [Acidimicrobiaceae bacterium]MYA74739.1 hypothetical protein [Acidimicrobiaceae bacterium]MYD06720.1 hypothetical protein [Acidimicrobiaceae bacterium]MYG54420.1 hypothetical protein [Acidimicrobiaceae bacterium]MYI58940.1 hypothetical protein [Acidimicrobiaceae bacterium]
MDTREINSDRPTTEAVDDIVGRLAPDEVATLQWLINEIRGRFGASDNFDPDDPKFNELVKQLASRVI